MDERPAAECEDLTKTYRTKTSSVSALRGVTASFPLSALSAVAGPSGSGKSSLLRLLAGTDRPTSGRLIVGGVDLGRARSRTFRRLRRRTGYVFQRASDNFFAHLTIAEHLRLAAARSSAAPFIDLVEMIELLRLTDRLDHLPAELSGGEQARAALAQVLAGGASMVVADEPTAELDSRSAEELLIAIETLVHSGVTAIVATHDRSVMERADQLLKLDRGLVRTGSRDTASSARPTRPPLRSFHQGFDGTSESSVARLSEVGKQYRRGPELVRAVRPTTMTLNSAEIVGLIGRSGSGKTTLLNIIAGWERPDEGSLSVCGEDPSGALLRWSDVSLVPQRLGLMEELTIRENIGYPARLSGSLKERELLVDDLLEATGLTDMQDRLPADVSLGEQQRAALARALVLSPRLLLADEPAGHQDAGWAREIFALLRRSVADGTCCLAATHDDDAVAGVDRILAMSDGTVTEMTA